MAWGTIKLFSCWAFENLFGEHKKMFRCFSGIPASMLINPPQRDWTECKSYIYVGVLIERKYPDVAIKAVNSVCIKQEYQMNLIGDGALFEDLQNYISNHGLNQKVFLRGRMKGKEIISFLDNSDVFIMISRNEVFGLVYLEAMARGCIVVAAKNEGMQGIINNGINGFLCESGNQQALEHILCTIQALSVEERKNISTEAMNTARKYTNEAVAEAYIKNIMNL